VLGQESEVLKEIIPDVTKYLIGGFWSDIPKPYHVFAGTQFRTVDGSGNSYLYPNMGKAGSKYSMSIVSNRKVNTNLPPAGQIFDRLFLRKKFEPHPTQISALLFCLGNLIIHDIFHSDILDPTLNLTSSYVELSPLYGVTLKQQHGMRTFKNGKLKPDTFADWRLLVQPPGLRAFVILFNRNHNFIAENILKRNEDGRFSSETNSAEVLDEKLFQTARNINIACYLNMVLLDYVRTILGLPPNSKFFLDAFINPPPSNPSAGNTVSLEFIYVYRWHSAISESDEAWIKPRLEAWSSVVPEAIKKTPPSSDPWKLQENLEEGFKEIIYKNTGTDFSYGLGIENLKRNPDGCYSDDDIGRLIMETHTAVAGRFGHHHIPDSFRPIEITGIEKARSLGICTFNEMRRFFKLKEMESFEDFCPDPEVAQALSELYGTVDDVELYTGLVIEKIKPIGISLGYTMSRAILSDAVNLLRNDRHCVYGLTPFNLTNWGYDLCKITKDSARYSLDFVRNTVPHYKHLEELVHDNIFVVPKK